MKVIFYISAVILAFISSALAQEYGKIAGTIIDAKTKEPISGAVIMVNGTALGANSDFKGYFIINKVPDSTYTVRIYDMGYKTVIKKKVKVKKHETTILKVKLIEEEILYDSGEHNQLGKVKHDQTQTIHIIPANEIEHLPAK